MKDCTRSSHSFCLRDRSKSMGRSSFLFANAFAPDCPPAARDPQAPFELLADARGTRAAGCGAIPSCGLTFPDVQTIVSYNCLNCNSLPEGSHGQRSDPDIH